jgi:hypothetical protein
MLVARRTVNELTPSSARERTGGVLSVANKHERALVRSLEERMCEPVCVLCWLVGCRLTVPAGLQFSADAAAQALQ